jgi:hypothetical protein
MFVVAAVLLLAPGAARAQVYGQLSSAETIPMNGHLFGAYLQASEDMLGLLAQLRLSFYPNVDFGFHGGITRLDAGSTDRTTLRIGGDLKVWVVKGGAVDLAAGGALGVETGDELSVLTLGPTVVASRTIAMGSGGGITPYGGVGLLFSNIDVGDNQETDFSLPFRFGAEFKLSPEIRLLGELQLRASDRFNDDIAFVTGVNLPF